MKAAPSFEDIEQSTAIDIFVLRISILGVHRDLSSNLYRTVPNKWVTLDLSLRPYVSA